MCECVCVCMCMRVCVQTHTMTLTDEDTQAMVDAHNMFRSATDPPAANMLRMVSIL